MEVNKENKSNLKPMTNEQPTVPKHLLVESKNRKSVQRHPLKIINSQPGPNMIVINKAKQKMLVDTRYVTIRQNSEILDWNYNVFKDERAEKSVTFISDDEEYLETMDGGKGNGLLGKKHRKCSSEQKKVVTPAVKSPLQQKVKNVKRSLKRPHSRELQGLSPVDNERKYEDKFRRRLYFNEPLKEKLKPLGFLTRSYMCSMRNYTEDLFAYLMETEKKSKQPTISSITRACVFNWLIRINGVDGNPAVVQTAIWYLDSILGIICVSPHKLQLFATACYWISQKIHGPMATAGKLVRYSNNAFTTEDLLITEKEVLSILKFPAQPVVAHEYITYLAWWCNNNSPGEIEVAATFLCMSGLMINKVLCDEYPSVVAAAAIRNALLLLRKTSLMNELQMCPVSAEKKAINLSITCSILRKAVRVVAGPTYDYKALIEQYGNAPYYIAQRISDAANELALLDARNTAGKY